MNESHEHDFRVHAYTYDNYGGGTSLTTHPSGAIVVCRTCGEVRRSAMATTTTSAWATWVAQL